MNVHPRVSSAASIIGNKVVNTDGEQLGTIKDLVIDLDDAQIAYAVLSFGGFLGLGDKLFAIPLEALTFDARETQVVLDVDKDVLKNAPGFDKDKWPDTAQYEAGCSIFMSITVIHPTGYLTSKREGQVEGARMG